jgi:hypothetical protein
VGQADNAQRAVSEQQLVVAYLAGTGDLRLGAKEAVTQSQTDVQRPSSDVLQRDSPLAVGDRPGGRPEGRDIGVGEGPWIGHGATV